MFGLPGDVYVVLDEGPTSRPCCTSNERLSHGCRAASARHGLQRAATLLPSEATQSMRADRSAAAGLTAGGDRRGAAPPPRRTRASGADSFDPFRERLPRLLDSAQRLTFEAYAAHGLGDLLARFVLRTDADGVVASYAFPTAAAQVTALAAGDPLDGHHGDADRTAARQPRAVGAVPAAVPPGAGDRHADRGRRSSSGRSATGGCRCWRCCRRRSAWSGRPGLLALAGAELDLFALFAVVTFVGIGVDYGIHLVQRYRERGDAGAGDRGARAGDPRCCRASRCSATARWSTSSYPPLRSIGIVSAVSVAALAVASVLSCCRRC